MNSHNKYMNGLVVVIGGSDVIGVMTAFEVVGDLEYPHIEGIVWRCCNRCVNRVDGQNDYCVHRCKYKLINVLNPGINTNCRYFVEKPFVLRYDELSVVDTPADRVK